MLYLNSSPFSMSDFLFLCTYGMSKCKWYHIQGGKTVVQLKEALVLIEEAESALQEADPTGEVVKTNVVIQASCQCACPTAIIDDSPEQSKLKEPLSAPF